jgi:hypothetical protein
MTQKKNILVLATAGMIALGSIAALAAPSSMNVRGTVVGLDGDTFETNASGGGTEKIRLSPNAEIVTVAPASLSDIKPGTFIGTAATPRADGALQAIEIHIFPESMRGTGEGNRAWDLGPRSTMTNGTVARRPGRVTNNKVSKVEGNSLMVEYNGGTQAVTLTPDTRVVMLVPATRSDIKPNAPVFIPGATKAADGVLEARLVTVGKDGMLPPM